MPWEHEVEGSIPSAPTNFPCATCDICINEENCLNCTSVVECLSHPLPLCSLRYFCMKCEHKQAALRVDYFWLKPF